MRYMVLIILALLLPGCASVDYAKYTEANVAMQTARSNAEAERYKALAAIAKDGDTAVQVAAAIALMMGNTLNDTSKVAIAAPKNPMDTAKDWAAILVPAAAQAFGFYTAMETNINASNNSRGVSEIHQQYLCGYSGENTITSSNSDHYQYR